MRMTKAELTVKIVDFGIVKLRESGAYANSSTLSVRPLTSRSSRFPA